MSICRENNQVCEHIITNVQCGLLESHDKQKRPNDSPVHNSSMSSVHTRCKGVTGRYCGSNASSEFLQCCR